MNDTPSPKAHLFLCTSCQNGKLEGSDLKAWRKEIRNKAWETHGKGNVLVTSSGCLGQCEHGVAAVLYPEGKWMTDLDRESEEMVLEAINELMEKALSPLK